MKEDVCVVIPVYNNEDTLSELHRRLLIHLEEFQFTIVYVVDASPDNSLSILQSYSDDHSCIKIIHLNTNIGQHGAILRGLTSLHSGWYVVMDADLQDAPELIPSLISKIKEGFDLVFVKRIGLYQSPLRMMTSRMHKSILQLLTGLDYRAGSYFIVSKSCLDKALNYFITDPTVPVLLTMSAHKVGYIESSRAYSPTPSSYNFKLRLKSALHSYKTILAIRSQTKSPIDLT